MLIILDGFGLNPSDFGNAIRLADTPNLDLMWTNFPKKGVLIRASESAVGLEQGYTGNSEVGHISIGSGQVLPQSLQRINESIHLKTFYKNKVINKAFKTAQRKGKRVHLMGILSNAGVHAHIAHLYALLEICQRLHVSPYLHLFLDGRDTGEQDGFFFLDRLNRKMKKLGIGKIASLSGRFYAMDRNTRWERTQKAYAAITGTDGTLNTDPFTAVQSAYLKKETDETFTPTILVDTDSKPVGSINDGDTVFFFNFREDRARQIAQALIKKDFTGFKRKKTVLNIDFLTMGGYAEGLKAKVIFTAVVPKTTISEIISRNGLKQLHIAETEKYAHISYFFNGGREEPHEGERFFRIPSPLVKDYATIPEMSAYKVKDEVVAQLKKGLYDFYLVNFANPDMIGHTGNLNAAIKAVEVTDECVGEIVNTALKLGGKVIITADHGNCEEMINPRTNTKLKSHTLNNVPFIIVDDISKYPSNIKIYSKGLNSEKLTVNSTPDILKVGSPEDNQPVGILADVGVTVLALLNLEPSPDMTGVNLNDSFD